MKKYSIIMLAVIFIMSSLTIEARTASKKKIKPSKNVEFKLNKSDVELIDKAIAGKFSNLSSKDKEKLIAILNGIKGLEDNKSIKSKRPSRKAKSNLKKSK